MPWIVGSTETCACATRGIGGVDYTFSFGLSIAGRPSLFVARVTGAAGTTFYQLLEHIVDVSVQKACTYPISIPADVKGITLSLAGQGVRTTVP